MNDLSAELAIAKPIVETACKLMENLLGEPSKVVGEMIRDKLYSWQWRNRIRIAYQAKQLLDKDGLAPHVLPPGFLLPLLAKAGDIDNPELQELWAQLLASAVKNKKYQHRRYIKILEELSPVDARILDCLYYEADEFKEYSYKELTELTGVEWADLLMSTQNSIRLGVWIDASFKHIGVFDAKKTGTAVSWTIIGLDFMEACTGRSRLAKRQSE